MACFDIGGTCDCAAGLRYCGGYCQRLFGLDGGVVGGAAIAGGRAALGMAGRWYPGELVGAAEGTGDGGAEGVGGGVYCGIRAGMRFTGGVE
jgi:hypothetical protein